MKNIKPLIEAILFIRGKKGIEHTELLEIINVEESVFENEMNELISSFEHEDRGLEIKKFGKKYLLVTKSNIHDKLFPEQNHIVKNPLNSSLIETLAIIAYNSPCTRTKIHDIKKIDPTQQIIKLLELDLIEEIGRADSQGKPFLYKVSEKFYDVFGIKNLSELPEIKTSSFDDEEDFDFFDSNREE
ncbi:MAG: SMC-Scp complex subunit ScpB [Mycoplasmoidaceae bacterium]